MKYKLHAYLYNLPSCNAFYLGQLFPILLHYFLKWNNFTPYFLPRPY